MASDFKLESNASAFVKFERPFKRQDKEGLVTHKGRDFSFDFFSLIRLKKMRSVICMQVSGVWGREREKEFADGSRKEAALKTHSQAKLFGTSP